MTSAVCVYAVEAYWQWLLNNMAPSSSGTPMGSSQPQRSGDQSTSSATTAIEARMLKPSVPPKMPTVTTLPHTQTHDLATTAFGLGFPGKPGPPPGE